MPIPEMPVPSKNTVWGLPGALSVMVTVAVYDVVPAVVGENVTLKVHEDGGVVTESGPEHELLVILKLLGLAPPNVGALVNVKGAVPLFVTVKV